MRLERRVASFRVNGGHMSVAILLSAMQRSRFKGSAAEIAAALDIQRPWDFRYLEDADAAPDPKALQKLKKQACNLHELQGNFRSTSARCATL